MQDAARASETKSREPEYLTHGDDEIGWDSSKIDPKTRWSNVVEQHIPQPCAHKTFICSKDDRAIAAKVLTRELPSVSLTVFPVARYWASASSKAAL